MVLPSTTEPALDSTPAATNRASTRVVLPPPYGPTRTTLRTSAGPFAVGASPAPWGALALSAMTFLQFYRGRFAAPRAVGHSRVRGVRSPARGVSQLTG